MTFLMGDDKGIDDCNECIPAVVCEKHLEADEL